MLKKIVIIILLLPLLFVGISFLLPEKTQVSRSVVIEKDLASVFEFLNHFGNFHRWSPWAKHDPEMKVVFSGPANGGGAKMAWTSAHPKVGSGSQEIIESLYPEKIHLKLNFEGQGEADAYFYFKDIEQKTELTWSFVADNGNNPLKRYLSLMMDKWVGADFEAGLVSLKTLLESTENSPSSEFPTTLDTIEMPTNVIMLDDKGKVIEQTRDLGNE